MSPRLSHAALALSTIAWFVSQPVNAAIVLTEGGVLDASSPSAGLVSAFGPTTINFDSGTGPLTSSGAILYTSGTTPFVAAAPFGDQTGYASIGSTTLPQTATLSLGTGVNYLGFYWGSVDSYNTLTLYDGSTVLATFTGSDVLNPANGYQGDSGSAFVNFFASGGDKITSATFTSTQAAFEVDSITASVPEPATWALMILGFLGIGFLAKRHQGRTFRLT